ncbi:hypothetical protein PA08_1536 [Cutibacterium modestum P08]|nr:hypothetical protein PA08_1536 [Cutibacterium modestum P08]
MVYTRAMSPMPLASQPCVYMRLYPTAHHRQIRGLIDT